MSNRSSYHDAIARELERAGVTAYDFEMGGKHPRVVFMKDGAKCVHGFPGTPSDSVRGLAQNVAVLRRILGLHAPKKVVSDRPRKRHSKTVAPDEVIHLTVGTNPLAKLAEWKPPSRFRWIKTNGREWRVEVIRPPD
jgi:hypothetical protein